MRDVTPVKTTRLTVGKVKRQKVHYPELSQPFFLVGSDKFSQAWLSQYAKRLQNLHAVGFLIQAATKQDWQRMQQLASGLSLLPTNGDIFAERFAIQHYPLLIANRLIEQ